MTRFVLIAIALTAGCFSRPAKHAANPLPDVPRVSVMSYNVNFGLAGDRATVRAVAQRDADVIFLQETTPEWEAALRTEMSSTYPHIAFKQSQGAGGLGVLSKLPIKSIDYLPPQSWFPAARIVLDTPIGEVQLLNVHLRPPISDRGSVVSGYFNTKGVREAEIATFAQSLDPKMPTLIVGDFNENDTGRAMQWLREHGYTSALGEFQPYAKTWRWRTSVGTLRGRYDHLCYNAKLRPLHAEVRDAGRSDHLPVVGVFTLAGRAQ